MGNKKMMSTLHMMLKHQCLQLERMTKKGDGNNLDGKNDDIISESGMSDDES